MADVSAQCRSAVCTCIGQGYVDTRRFTSICTGMPTEFRDIFAVDAHAAGIQYAVQEVLIAKQSLCVAASAALYRQCSLHLTR